MSEAWASEPEPYRVITGLVAGQGWWFNIQGVPHGYVLAGRFNDVEAVAQLIIAEQLGVPNSEVKVRVRWPEGTEVNYDGRGI